MNETKAAGSKSRMTRPLERERLLRLGRGEYRNRRWVGIRADGHLARDGNEESDMVLHYLP